MKPSNFFGIVVLSILIKQNEAISKDEVASKLASINNFVGNFATQANNELHAIIQNTTHWQETQVQQLVQRTTELTSKVFSVINSLDSVFNSTLLACIVQEEPTLLQAIENATQEFGYCSTKLETNLTVDLKELTELMIGNNACFKAYIDELISCDDKDAVCLQNYGENVKAFVNDLIKLGQFATVFKKIAISYDKVYDQVYNCAKSQFFPQVFDAVHRAHINVQMCSSDMLV